MKIGIFGASGFAREVGDICLDLGYKEIIFIDKHNEKSIEKNRQNILGIEKKMTVLDEGEVYSLAQAAYTFAIGIGDPVIRKNIYLRYKNIDDLVFVNLIHPSVTFGYEQLQEAERQIGNIFCAGSRLTNNIQIGNFGVYYLNCTVAHDCIIEDFVTIAPGATVSGNVWLSECVYIGANATILQGRSIHEKLVIGTHSIIGAGAVVTKNVPDHTVVKGIPAK